ncbi:unnamed protein product [Auanema sp. JU1783]|nr:unnamed protein product [Auanema sp. JU1783]
MSRVWPQNSCTVNASPSYTVYGTRWIVLAVCFLVTLSNSTMWLGLSAVGKEADVFYCGPKKNCQAAFITNQIFQLVAIFAGVPGMYLTDKMGIRPALFMAVLFNLVGAIIRTCSSLPSIQNFLVRQSLLYTGSIIVAISQSFFLVLPTKIAEGWFSEKQRSIANVLLFISNPIGAAIGMSLPVMYFAGTTWKTARQITTTSNFLNFNIAIALTALLSLLGMILVPTSLPPTPASQAHEVRSKKEVGFQESLRICLKDKEFIKLLFSGGATYSIFWGFLIIIPSLIPSKSSLSAGAVSAVMLMLGTVSALCLGDVMDKTKKFLGIFQCLVLSGAVVLVMTHFFLVFTGWKSVVSNILATLLFSSFSCCTIPLLPITFELGVEITFPAQEATVTGLMVIAGNLILLLVYAAVELLNSSNIYSPTGLASIDFLLVLILLTNILVFVFMKPEYKRLKAESQPRTLFEQRY